ncbi:MAG: hypothetical protein WAP35_02230 [Solirubrobacterales bacterium]
MNAIVCSGCGAGVVEGDRFCMSCGAAVPTGAAAVQTQTPPSAAVPSTPPYSAPSPGYSPPAASGYPAAGQTGYVMVDARPQNGFWRFSVGCLLTALATLTLGLLGVLVVSIGLAIGAFVASASSQRNAERVSSAFVVTGITAVLLGIYGVVWSTAELTINLGLHSFGMLDETVYSSVDYEAIELILQVVSAISLLAGIALLIASAVRQQPHPSAPAPGQRGYMS